MNLMSIYNISPIFIQNLFTTIQGYIYKRERYGKEYINYLEELRKRDYTNLDEIMRIQNTKAKEFISYAYKNSAFYKEFYKDIEIDNICNIDDIKKLPILEKEFVRSNITKMYTISTADGVKSNTSGTTGTSITFLYTKKDLQKRMAYLDHFKEQHGFIHMKMKRASFNSAKIIPKRQKKMVFWRDNLAIKQRIYSGYHCKGNHLKYYVNNINRYMPDSIDGYPSAIYQVAKYILENNIKLNFKPKAIFPTAETLLPHYKKVIEKAFNCPVVNQYASSEGAPFITECKFGKLHYCLDTGIIEVEKTGEILVTCFETHGTPLIRYKIGDKIVIPNTKEYCECGSMNPIVKEIEGRNIDYLSSISNGNFSSIYLSLVSEEFNNSIKKMQFIQNKIEEIEIYLEVDKNYNIEMNKIIEEKLQYSFGTDMKFTIYIVDEIANEPSGKFRLIKNNLK